MWGYYVDLLRRLSIHAGPHDGLYLPYAGAAGGPVIISGPEVPDYLTPICSAVSHHDPQTPLFGATLPCGIVSKRLTLIEWLRHYFEQ